MTSQLFVIEAQVDREFSLHRWGPTIILNYKYLPCNFIMITMGGKKKPTISQLEKRMRKINERKKTQGKEHKKVKMSLSTKGALTVKSLDLLYKEIARNRVITPYAVSDQFKIKIGVAKRALKDLERKGLIKLVDKNRRVSIYVPTKLKV